ncbi:hypothetical protein [Caulobacter segnis]
MNINTIDNDLVDPDPVVIAGLAISLVAAITPLVQLFRKQPPTEFHVHILQQQPLMELERAVDGTQSHLKAIQRCIDRGSPNSDAQFYDAPLRLLQTSMELERSIAQQYATSSASLFTTSGHIYLWILNIIQNHPQLAARLGKKLDRPLQEIAERLNAIMADGRPIREAITELKAVLSNLASAIEDELNSNQGN